MMIIQHEYDEDWMEQQQQEQQHSHSKIVLDWDSHDEIQKSSVNANQDVRAGNNDPMQCQAPTMKK
jgi:D-ribose pyranose/furanose isomerase RbsD